MVNESSDISHSDGEAQRRNAIGAAAISGTRIGGEHMEAVRMGVTLKTTGDKPHGSANSDRRLYVSAALLRSAASCKSGGRETRKMG